MVDLGKVKKSDLWYVVGYIASDGYLSNDGRHINITSKDREQLYLIRSALFLKNSIGRKTRGHETIKKYSQLQFGDVKFYKFLLNIGFVQKKSLNLGEVTVDQDYFYDFLRGVIDGDGNISTWIHKTNFNSQWCLRIFSASNVFIRWLYDKIKADFSVDGRIYIKKPKDRINPYYTIKFGKKAAKVILEKIYYNGCLSLERKLKQAKLCLQDTSKMVNYTN